MNNNTKSKRRREHKAGEHRWQEPKDNKPKVGRSAPDIMRRLNGRPDPQ